MYEEIHSFIRQREWGHAHPEAEAGGITWAEMFIVFDTGGYRTDKGQHIRNPEAAKRAEARKDRSKEAKKNRRNSYMSSAAPKATYDQELKTFKAIFREITRHDLDEHKRKWFLMEQRQHLKRLAPLGIGGNQPAIAAYCKTSREEQATIAEALLQQKVGANIKEIRKAREHRRGVEDDRKERKMPDPILLNIGRSTQGAIVKWKRNHKYCSQQGSDDDANQISEAHSVKYTTRMLACTRCGQAQETALMQLRCSEGFRAVHCRNCGRQERCARNCCQCGVLWHHCLMHRVDPEKHVSRKPPKKTEEAKQLEREELQKARGNKGPKKVGKAPIIEDNRSEASRSKASKTRKEESFYRQQGYQNHELIATMQAMQLRIREKLREREATKGEEPTGSNLKLAKTTSSQTVSPERRKRTMDDDTKPRAVQRRLRGKQKKPAPLETSGTRKRKLEEDQVAERETEQKKTKGGDEITNGATSSRGWSHSRVVQTNARRLSTESCGKNNNNVDNHA